MMHDRPVQFPILSARGVACFLLVAYHVVGSAPDSGLRLPAESGWHYAMDSVEFLRMPLFSVLSGYLYAIRRPNRETLTAFAKGKFRRIVAPLLFATLVTFWLRRQIYGPDVSLFEALFFHYQHFWFLQALLVIFAVMAMADVIRPSGWAGLIIASFAAVMIERSATLTPFFSLNGAVYLFPFFSFGMILRLSPLLLQSADVRRIALFVLPTVLIAQQAGMAFGTTAVLRNSVPAAIAGCAASLLLLAYLPSVKPLEVVGRYSYSIYIWHSISAAAARTWLSAFDLPIAVRFVLILAFGLSFPILLQRLVDRVPVLAMLMMGLKPRDVPRRRAVPVETLPSPVLDDRRIA